MHQALRVSGQAQTQGSNAEVAHGSFVSKELQEPGQPLSDRQAHTQTLGKLAYLPTATDLSQLSTEH